MAGRPNRQVVEDATVGQVMQPQPESRLAGMVPVREHVETAQRNADIAFRSVLGNMLDNPDCRRTMRSEGYQLLDLFNREEIFENCTVQFAYNQRQRIYSIQATLDGRPRIITMRVGDQFSEVSLADASGNILEVVREGDGRGITMSRTG